jgi:hypothetical protein
MFILNRTVVGFLGLRTVVRGWGSCEPLSVVWGGRTRHERDSNRNPLCKGGYKGNSHEIVILLKPRCFEERFLEGGRLAERGLPGLEASFALVLSLGVSSTSSVSRLSESGRMKYRTLFPRTLKWSRLTGFLPFSVSFTLFMCVFMQMSTPAARLHQCTPGEHTGTGTTVRSFFYARTTVRIRSQGSSTTASRSNNIRSTVWSGWRIDVVSHPR